LKIELKLELQFREGIGNRNENKVIRGIGIQIVLEALTTLPGIYRPFNCTLCDLQVAKTINKMQ
jgi:hypothetical protein